MLFAFHFIHGAIPFEFTSHERWGIGVKKVNRILFILWYRAGSTLWRFLSGRQSVDFHNNNSSNRALLNPKVVEPFVGGCSEFSFLLPSVEPVPCEHINWGLESKFIPPVESEYFSWYTYVGDWWGEAPVPEPYEINTIVRWGPEELLSLGDDWTFIHLIRNGRNQIESLRSLRGGYEEEQLLKNPEEYFMRLVKGYRNRGQMVIDNQKLVPRYYIHKFEDFVFDPISEMKKMYNEIGIQLDIKFVQDAYKLTQQEVMNRHSSFSGKGNLLNRWEDKWTENEKGVFEIEAGMIHRTLGYV